MTLIESASAEPEAWFKLDRDSRTLNVGGASDRMDKGGRCAFVISLPHSS
jgi:hypothetical protein